MLAAWLHATPVSCSRLHCKLELIWVMVPVMLGDDMGYGTGDVRC